MEQAHTSHYAGFWKRVMAFLLDGLIIGAAAWVLGGFGLGGGHMSGYYGGYGYGYGYGMMQGAWGNNDGLGFIKLVIGWLYFAFMESSEHQASLGKMALGIKVTDLDGKRIDFGRATGRYFGTILTVLTVGIGFLMVAFTEKKQALHDILSKTLVVNK